MKPILIYLPVDKSEKVILTKEEIQSLLNQVYEQGKADGQALEKPVISYPVPFPQYPVSPWIVSPDSSTYPQITWTASSGIRLCTAADGKITINSEQI